MLPLVKFNKVYKLLSFVLILIFSGCASVPITHRKQMNLVSEFQLIESSKLAYSDFLNENDVVNSFNPRAMEVKEVGQKLSLACEQFMRDYGMVDRISGYNWEFNLVNSNEANAWCMPGGKVVVYSGLLEITKDKDGLATVLGHEIAHAVARHSNERMSQQLIAQAGGSALQAVLSASTSTSSGLDELIFETYTLTSSLGILNFSRNQEMEADKMGLVFMEYAGYDSSKSIEFWKRMEQQPSGDLPVFFKTHPSHSKRILEIEAFIPVAKSYVNN